MLQFLKIVSVVFFVAVVAFAQAEESTVRGAVMDSEGAVISKARVLLHWDPAGSPVGLKTNIGIKEDREVTTNENGVFQARLPWGFYDMVVSATAFSPYCQKIRVRGNQTCRSNSTLITWSA